MQGALGKIHDPERARRRLRHSGGTGTARPQRRANHYHLLSSSQSGRQGRPVPGGQLVGKKEERLMGTPNKTLDSSQMPHK
jgi:hypothetical protein